MMGKRTHGTWGVALIALTLLLAPIAPAQAQFTDYRAAARDQYDPPPGSNNPPNNPPPNNPPPNNPPPNNGSGGEQSRGNDRDGGGTGPGSGGGRPGGGGAGPASGGGGPAGLPTQRAQGTTLPFTGWDTTMLVLIGLLLVGAGCAVRASQRVSRRVAR